MLFHGMVKFYTKKAIITHHILMKMIKNGKLSTYMEYRYIDIEINLNKKQLSIPHNFAQNVPSNIDIVISFVGTFGLIAF